MICWLPLIDLNGKGRRVAGIVQFSWRAVLRTEWCPLAWEWWSSPIFEDHRQEFAFIYELAPALVQSIFWPRFRTSELTIRRCAKALRIQMVPGLSIKGQLLAIIPLLLALLRKFKSTRLGAFIETTKNSQGYIPVSDTTNLLLISACRQ